MFVTYAERYFLIYAKRILYPSIFPSTIMSTILNFAFYMYVLLFIVSMDILFCYVIAYHIELKYYREWYIT